MIIRINDGISTLGGNLLDFGSSESEDAGEFRVSEANFGER